MVRDDLAGPPEAPHAVQELEEEPVWQPPHLTDKAIRQTDQRHQPLHRPPSGDPEGFQGELPFEHPGGIFHTPAPQIGPEDLCPARRPTRRGPLAR